MLNDNLETATNKLKILKDQGIDTHGVFNSYFFYFFVEQTSNFPKFVEWCASNYSPFEGLIVDASRSKILCPLNSLAICNTLLIPANLVQMLKEYKDEKPSLIF